MKNTIFILIIVAIVGVGFYLFLKNIKLDYAGKITKSKAEIVTSNIENWDVIIPFDFLGAINSASNQNTGSNSIPTIQSNLIK